MPQKTTIHLHFPSHNAHVTVKKKLPLDGIFVDEKAGVKVPLTPSMATNLVAIKKGSEKQPLTSFLEHVEFLPGGRAEKEIWIDGERGLQVRYDGVRGYVGPDGRMMMASRAKDHAKALQTRGISWEKFMWPLVIFILGTFAALVFALSMVAKHRGG